MIASRTQSGWRRRRSILYLYPAMSRASPDSSPGIDHIWIARLPTASAASLIASMRVAGAGEILRRTAKFHQNRSFVNHFTGFDADDMHAEHAIGLRICENLHEAIRGLIHLGAAVGGKREFTGIIRDSRLLQLFLGLAHRRNLRRGIHNTWDHIVVHMAGLSGDDLRTRHAFVLGLVCEHRTGDDVADGVDAFHAGGEVWIDLHAAAIVERDASFLAPETIGVGHAADTDQHDVGFP